MTSDFINGIHLGKWEKMMPQLDSNSIDLIVTSPPYNVSLGVNNKHKKDAYAECDDNMPYNEYLEWMEKLFMECNRVLKEGGRLCINIGDGANGSVPTHVDFTYKMLHLFDKNQSLERQELAECDTSPYLPFKMMTTIVWDKSQIGAPTAWGSWKSPSCPSFPTQFEFIIIVAKGTTKHIGDNALITVTGDDFICNSRALWTFSPETRMMKDYGHPAMFPEELPRRCIDQLTYKNDIILDPFSGAGTTCTAAKRMGRQYIGFEMTEEYVTRSIERTDLVPKTVTTEDGCEVPAWMVTQ